MKCNKPGVFYGKTNIILPLENLTLTKTEYNVPVVDWHYHQNAYFTFITHGNLIEGTKRGKYYCSTGDLLFHNWDEPHYNIKPDVAAGGIHVEIEKAWLKSFDIREHDFEGKEIIENPKVKILFHQIHKELTDGASQAGIDSLLLNVFSLIRGDLELRSDGNPSWVRVLFEIIHSQTDENLNLLYLAKQANRHPVHISREFKKYFGCNLGDYLRATRIEKSLCLLLEQKIKLTEVAHLCGFADQSHFIRWFKKFNGISPLTFRKKSPCRVNVKNILF